MIQDSVEQLEFSLQMFILIVPAEANDGNIGGTPAARWTLKKRFYESFLHDVHTKKISFVCCQSGR